MYTRRGLETVRNENIFYVAQRYYSWIRQQVLLRSTTTVPLAQTAYFARGVCCIAVCKIFIFVVDYTRQNSSNTICVIHEDCVVCTCEEYRYKQYSSRCFVVDYTRQNLSNIICVIHEDCVVCTCEEYRQKQCSSRSFVAVLVREYGVSCAQFTKLLSFAVHSTSIRLVATSLCIRCSSVNMEDETPLQQLKRECAFTYEQLFGNVFT